MTVSTADLREEYTATAGQTVFTFSFRVFGITDVKVYKTPTGVSFNDAAYLTTAYTVTVNADQDANQGGSITLNAGATAGDRITIISNVADTRATDYKVGGKFDPDVVDNDFDRSLSIAKQAKEAISLAPRFQESAHNASGIALPDLEANAFWQVNAAGNGLKSTFTLDSSDVYTISAVAPSSPDTGELWFDTANNVMKVYDGSGFVPAGSSVNGTSERYSYVATAGQTTFTAVYDGSYVDVYLNGVKLVLGTDFTATSGTNIVLSAGAAAGDTVDIIGYGAFELSGISVNSLSDATTAGITNGQYLAYNTSNARFEPATLPTSALNDLSDVTTSGVSNGQYLAYNSSNSRFEPIAPPNTLVHSVDVTTTSSQGITSNTTTDITNLTIDITPQSSNSTFLLMGAWNGEFSDTNNLDCVLGFRRNGVSIGQPIGSGTNRAAGRGVVAMGHYNVDAASTMDSWTGQYLDSPSTSSQITYTISFRHTTNGTLYNNRTVTDTDASNFERTTSSLIILEFV